MPPSKSFFLDTLVPSYCWPYQWLDSTDALPRESKYITVGWHPTCTHKFQSISLQQFEAALNIPNVVTLGEAGLDYHREASSTGRAQQQALLSMCQLAHQYNLPLVVHCHDPDDHQSTTVRGLNGSPSLLPSGIPPLLQPRATYFLQVAASIS